MDPSQIEKRITEHLTDAVVRVRDTTGGGDHFEALVVSERFRGKPRVAQHRLVYEALGPSVGAAIHALALKTLTPDQWQSELQARGGSTK